MDDWYDFVFNETGQDITGGGTVAAPFPPNEGAPDYSSINNTFLNTDLSGTGGVDYNDPNYLNSIGLGSPATGYYPDVAPLSNQITDADGTVWQYDSTSGQWIDPVSQATLNEGGGLGTGPSSYRTADGTTWTRQSDGTYTTGSGSTSRNSTLGNILNGAASGIGAALGSHAATSAANTQSTAALQAAQLQYQASQAALAETARQFNIGQQNQAPWLQAGQGALASMSSLLGINPANYPAAGGSTVGATNTGAAATPATTYQPGQFYSSSGQQVALPNLQNFLSSANLDPSVLSDPGTLAQLQQYIGTQTPSGVIYSVDANGQWTSLNAQTGVQTQVAAPSFTTATPAATGATATPAAGTGANGTTFGSFTQDIPLNLPAALNLQAFNPTQEDIQIDPGYAWRLQQGQQAIERSAAARGNYLSGGTARALEDYAQGQASQEYQNAYTRAQGQYTTGINAQTQNYAAGVDTALQNFNATRVNRGDLWSRLSGLSGTGQNSATTLGNLGSSYAANVANNLTNTATNVGNLTTSAAASQAAGQVASTNAWTNALSQLVNQLNSQQTLSALLNQG